MATYLDRAALAQHEVFRKRVRAVAVKTAVDVAAEAPSGDAAVDAKRADLATNTLNDADNYEGRFAWAAISNPTVADTGLASTDGDLEFVVSSIWNALAGV